MKPPFTSTQEMYNYAANQLIVQNLSQDAVKRNLMERGVSDADAEIVIQNMMVQINKDKSTKSVANSSAAADPTQQNFGSFATLQEMYNYAAKLLITEKQSQETTRRNLLSHGISEAQADEVIKNMMVEINKNKPKEVNAKRSEAQKMMLVGIIIAVVGFVLLGTKFNIAGQGFGIGYGVLIVGALLFFRGLFRMF